MTTTQTATLDINTPLGRALLRRTALSRQASVNTKNGMVIFYVARHRTGGYSHEQISPALFLPWQPDEHGGWFERRTLYSTGGTPRWAVR